MSSSKDWPDPFDPDLPYHPPNIDPHHFDPLRPVDPHIEPHNLDPSHFDDGLDIVDFNKFSRDVTALNEDFELVTSTSGLPSAIMRGGERAAALYEESLKVLKLEQQQVMGSMMKTYTSYLTESTKAETFLANKMISQADYDAYKAATAGAEVKFSEAFAKIKQMQDLQLKVHEAQYKSFGQGMESLEAQELQSKYDSAVKSVNEVKKQLDANEALAKAAGVKETSLKQELEEAEKALADAKASGTEAEELLRLTEEVDKVRIQFKHASETAERARSAWNATKATFGKAESLVRDVTGHIDEKLDYFIDGNFKEWDGLIPNPTRMAMGRVKDLTRLIESISSEIYGPIQTYAQSLTKAGDIMLDGFKTYMEKLVSDTGSVDEYYASVMKRTQELSAPAKARMEKNIEGLKNLINNGATEDEVFEFTASFASPSFKMYAATLDEFKVLWNKKILVGDGFELFRIIVLPFKWGTFVLKSAAKGITGSVFKVLEILGRKAGGQAGFRFMAGLAEGTFATFKFGGELLAKYFSPEVQGVLMLFHMAKDTQGNNNKYQTEEKVLHELPFADLYINFDPLRIREYPEFSKTVKSKVPEHDLLNIHAADTAEQNIELDFWGDMYIDIKRLQGHRYPKYKRMPPFNGVMRVPGLYIPRDPKQLNSKTDSLAMQRECIRLDKDLELGQLVDEGGTLSNEDKGQNLIIRDFPRHKEDDKYVRNLVDFPLYQNTMYWPPLSGSAFQIDGQFEEKNVDPTIAEAFRLWVTTGQWGSVYKLAKSRKVQLQAAETNKKDLQQFLEPQRTDEAWLDVEQWVANNKGKRVIMIGNMPKVSLEEFDKEYNQPENSDWFPKKIHDEFGGLLTSPQTKQSDLAIKVWRDQIGRWPMHSDAIAYYKAVISGTYFHARKSSVGFVSVYRADPVRSTRDQIEFFKRLMKEQLAYREALVKAHGDIDQAWNQVLEDTTWQEYLNDTQSGRTVWGYIQKNRVMLVDELSSIVMTEVGNRKQDVWEEYMKAIMKAHVPLNMNSYARTKFMAQLNMACFDESTKVQENTLNVIKKVTGEFKEDEFIHTQELTATEKNSWYKYIMSETFVKLLYDLPVYFGKLMCRMIVIDKPKPTLFIVFKGTTSRMEALVDLDITSTEYCSLLKGDGKDEYGLHVFSEKETTVNTIKHLFYSDPSAFAVHRGFLRAWKGFAPKVIEKIKLFYERYDIQDVMVTGHSLGAAVAQICCLEMPGFQRKSNNLLSASSQYIRPHYYGFASPNVGDFRFTNVFAEQCSESIQCFTDGDIVTATPPFLIPSKEGWSSSIETFMRDLEGLAEDKGSALANIFSVLSFIMGKEGVKLPPIFQPVSWYDGKGDTKGKIIANLLNISDAMNKHQAKRGGGLFIRIDPTRDGQDEQHPYDFGSSAKLIGMLVSFAKKEDRINAAKQLHSMQQILDGLNRMVGQHPDDFAIIDGKVPGWAGVKGSNPGKLNPFPHHEKDISKAKVIGYAHTKHHHAPFQVVERSDVDSMQYIHDPINVNKRSADEMKRRRRNRKKYRTENDYHTY